jgi:hypothetical protein
MQDIPMFTTLGDQYTFITGIYTTIIILQKLAFCKICYSVCCKIFILQCYSVCLFVILQKLAFCKICYSVCLFFYLAKLQKLDATLYVCGFLFFGFFFGLFVFWVFFVCNHFCSAFTPSTGLTSI